MLKERAMKGLGTKLGAAAGAAGLVVLLSAAQRPGALAQTSGGQWELSGLPGSAGPVRRCVADPMTFAQIEHRGQSCSQGVISDSPSSAVVNYTCSNGGFGRTELTVLTPRSIRIQTQGISRGAPFNYVVQARRVGSCGDH